MADRAALLIEALTLPEEERKLLAFELLDSTDFDDGDDLTIDPEVEKYWEEEIKRRLEANPPGTRGIPWDVVKQHLANLTAE